MSEQGSYARRNWYYLEGMPQDLPVDTRRAIIAHLEDGESQKDVAEMIEVSVRGVGRVWATFKQYRLVQKPLMSARDVIRKWDRTLKW